jgi:hypothetical protein
MQLSEPQQPPLPAPIEEFVSALNSGNLEALLATFAAHALVNDQLREYWGSKEIAEWARHDLTGQHLTLQVGKVTRNGDHTVIAARVDGDFEKRGLPDPLIVTFYFSVLDGKLVQLIILRNETLA